MPAIHGSKYSRFYQVTSVQTTCQTVPAQSALQVIRQQRWSVYFDEGVFFTLLSAAYLLQPFQLPNCENSGPCLCNMCREDCLRQWKCRSTTERQLSPQNKKYSNKDLYGRIIKYSFNKRCRFKKTEDIFENYINKLKLMWNFSNYVFYLKRRK